MVQWSQGHLYATPDGRLKIFACDLFLLIPQLVGGLEAVWDRSGGGRRKEEEENRKEEGVRR